MPSFFTRELREQLAATQARLDEAEAINAKLAQDLITARTKAVEDKALLTYHYDERIRHMTKESDRIQQIHMQEQARAQGVIVAMKADVHLLALIKEQHEWVRDGQSLFHGVLCDVWKCAHEAGNRDGMRVHLPAKTKWLARQEEPDGEEETTASTERIDWRTPATS